MNVYKVDGNTVRPGSLEKVKGVLGVDGGEVDGKELEDWAFYLQPLGDHWVTVARGPPSDVVDAYGEFTKTLRKVAFSKQAWEQEIRAGQPGFAILGIRDLLPSQRRKSYEDIVDEDPFC